MNKLIIAEKPMLARDIARVMCGKSGNLPLRGNGYTVVTCAGHLLQLAEPGDLDAKWSQWNISDLPIAPKSWYKKISKGKKDLVDIIKKELKSADSVINAGDPDDEGQLIIDEVLDYLNYSGKVERVLISDSLDKNIKKAFDRLQDNKIYFNMGKSALSRQIADYAFGVNESRLAALRMHESKISVGRVQTPTLGLIVNRDREIENHKIQKYFTLEVIAELFNDDKDHIFKFKPNKEFLDGQEYIFDKNKLENVVENIPDKLTCDCKHTTNQKSAPLPYNLTKLQSAMSKKYGYSAKKTLNITQELRDKYKAITYNRTDCQYLSEEHYTQAKNVIPVVVKNISSSKFNNIDTNIKHKCFNDKYISAHHAIIPQEIEVNMSLMSKECQNVYKEIAYSYLRLFLPDQVLNISSCEYKLYEGTLVLEYKKVIEEGWAIGSSKDKNSNYNLDEGTYTFGINDKIIKDQETKPKSRYTEGTLIADMSSIAKYCKDPEIRKILKTKDEDKKGENGGIGTTSTRADIIEKLKQREFIKVENKKIISTQRGRDFYDAIPEDIKTADITAKWWLIQQQVLEGKKDEYAVMKSTIECFMSHKDSAYTTTKLSKSEEKKVICKCPKCDNQIIIRGKVATCESNKIKKENGKWVELDGGCGFKMFTEICKKKLTYKQISDLISGKTIKVSGLKSKAGKNFTANLNIESYDGNNGFAKIKFSF